VKLFLPQSTLEEWAIAEKADLSDGKLVVAESKVGYPVTPAVHFKSVASGTDEQKLLERVKTEEQLKKLGAEHDTGTVILGENAYDVAEGFVAEVPNPAGDPGKKTEADMLAQFLLGKS
jgi:hypothetical protein